jgi:hypothetical protein
VPRASYRVPWVPEAALPRATGVAGARGRCRLSAVERSYTLRVEATELEDHLIDLVNKSSVGMVIACFFQPRRNEK